MIRQKNGDLLSRTLAPENYCSSAIGQNASFHFSEIIYSSLWMTSDLLSARSEFLRFEF